MEHNAKASLKLDRLLKLRLVVGRFGEMDLARWWNTQGLLGSRGAIVFKRGFPLTHYFAQARVVFAVARSRCRELFPNPPASMTLWDLPADIEDQFEERWQGWLDEGEIWAPVFEQLASVAGDDLLAALEQFDLVTRSEHEEATKLRRSAENRAVLLPGAYKPDDAVLTMLAAGFVRGEPGNLAIPYAKLENGA